MASTTGARSRASGKTPAKTAAQKAAADDEQKKAPDPYDQPVDGTPDGGTPPPLDAEVHDVPDAGDKATQPPSPGQPGDPKVDDHKPAGKKTTGGRGRSRSRAKASRVETYERVRPDGSRVTITRDLDTGEHSIVKG